MPRKNSKPKRTPFDDVVWCMDNLSTAQLKQHDDKPYTPEEVIEGFNRLVEMGFKISIKTDDYTGNKMISAVCDEVGKDNAGLALSARSEDVEDMSSILLWKFFNVAEGDLRPFADKKQKSARG